MKQYVVDAFAGHVFEGNPAAVCLPERWPSEERMMAITRENNLSETAFAVREGEDWRLRWFTPGGEIDLCGHATLAAAYAIGRFVDRGAAEWRFHTLSGLLTVKREGELLSMDFPAYTLKRLEVTQEIEDALGARPREVWRARDLVCVFDDPETVIHMKPEGRSLTASPAPSPPRWRCPRTRCAAPATATSCPTGRTGWAGRS